VRRPSFQTGSVERSTSVLECVRRVHTERGCRPLLPRTSIGARRRCQPSSRIPSVRATRPSTLRSPAIGSLAPRMESTSAPRPKQLLESVDLQPGRRVDRRLRRCPNRRHRLQPTRRSGDRASTRQTRPPHPASVACVQRPAPVLRASVVRRRWSRGRVTSDGRQALHGGLRARRLRGRLPDDGIRLPFWLDSGRHLPSHHAGPDVRGQARSRPSVAGAVLFGHTRKRQDQNRRERGIRRHKRGRDIAAPAARRVLAGHRHLDTHAVAFQPGDALVLVRKQQWPEHRAQSTAAEAKLWT